MSKETALAIPLVMAALILFYPNIFAMPSSARRLRFLLFALPLLALCGAGWVLFSLHRKAEHTVGIGLAKNALGYLAGQAQVVAAYLKLILWPSGLVVDHAFKPAPFLSVHSLACWLLVILIPVLLFRIRRSWPEASFWGIAFIILLLPTSSLIPSADLMFEHRLYLPMVAGSALLSWLLFRLCRSVIRNEAWSKAALLALMTVALTSYALESRQRTYVWGDNIRLWRDAVAKVPSNPRAHYNLAVAYLGVDRRAAYDEFGKTIEIQPAHAAANYNLGWLEQSDGRLEAARGYYEAAIHGDASSWQAHVALANLNVLQGRTTEAIAEYKTAIRLRRDIWTAYESLASLQIRSGDPDGALATLEGLLPEQPDRLEARYLKAYALAASRRFNEAKTEIRLIRDKDRTGVYAPRIRELESYLSSSQ